MIAHILAINPFPGGLHGAAGSVPTPVPRVHGALDGTAEENRTIYSFLFTVACVWVTCTFLFSGFRDWQKWFPGGWVLCNIGAITLIAVTAAELR